MRQDPQGRQTDMGVRITFRSRRHKLCYLKGDGGETSQTSTVERKKARTHRHNVGLKLEASI